MHILFLDLASHNGLLACATEEAVVALDDVDHRIDDAELVARVESLLKKAGWSYQSLTHIACVIGPGGFTSLRVAVALANTLSSQLGIPTCGIHLSDVYRARDRDSDAIWLHSTKKNELFIRDGTKHPEPTCITLDEFRLHLGVVRTDEAGWMGELTPEHRKIVDEAGPRSIVLRPLQEVLPAFLKTRDYPRQILTPWYGRGW